MLEKYRTQEPNKAEGPKTYYIRAFVYEEDELQFIQTSEGLLVPNGNGGYNYEYPPASAEMLSVPSCIIIINNSKTFYKNSYI